MYAYINLISKVGFHSITSKYSKYNCILYTHLHKFLHGIIKTFYASLEVNGWLTVFIGR